MPPIADTAIFQKGLAALPVATYQPGQTVFAAGAKTGLLLILEKGAVAVVKDAVEIAKVSEPGAVFGELSALLDQPHGAEVRAVEASQFRVADAATLIQDPVSLLFIATTLARRLNAANQVLIELKSQIQADQPTKEISKTLKKMETVLSASGGNLAYAGYPFDPYA